MKPASGHADGVGIDFGTSNSLAAVHAGRTRMVPLEVDGEFVGRTDAVDFRPAERGLLRVLAPREPIGSRFEEAVKAITAWTKKPWGPPR
jgi:hypothetical protein